MPGPYLIGVDGGTQSSKVVVYDAAGNIVAQGREALRPMSRPRHGIAFHPDDDLWDSIAAASRRAMAGFDGERSEIVAVGLCTIRCCKAFLEADGSLAEPVISWMDDRAYQPYRPDDPAVAYATTSSGYLGHRFTGEFRDSAANNILLQWPIDTDRWQWSDDPKLFEQFSLRREMLLELQMPGDIVGYVTTGGRRCHRHPGRASRSSRPPTTRPSRCSGSGLARRDDGAGLARHLHRGDGSRAREPQGADPLLDELRAASRNRYLYESNGVRRGMWTLTLVPRSARRRGRRAGRVARPVAGGGTSRRRPQRCRPAATD